MPLFALIPSFAFSILTPLLYILLDLLCAEALVSIADSCQSTSSRLFTSPRKDVKWDSIAIAAAYDSSSLWCWCKLTEDDRYLFNPLTIATYLGRPTSVFTNCVTLFAISKAVQNKPFNAMLALALASYLSLYPALLLPPLLLLCYDQREQNPQDGTSGPSPFLIWISVFFGGLGLLLFMSYLVTGASWEFLSSTYGVQLLLPDLTPNVGLWWYFFIEMFDSFREFFLGVFWLHLGAYVGGLCIRVRNQPLFAITTMIGIFAIFKPYPSISDTSLYFALLPLYRHVFPCKFRDVKIKA